ncbi:RNase H family protein [Corynebacterium glucuronolyticum]|uniref:RNase H family protein n=1 Tax=Corynebacterium glucuronolyticum TaxID=39791 RepID=UPI00019C1CBF|nr:RNase H family protein [Corynebacterium glucuronolyticum]EEI27730.1 ribonuclease HI [Corynebacterium glucuronolyticum ATCC 51867]QRO82134.1 hypothetical protein I6J20_09725 [Corynebacterium glucuronolyticum]
MFIPVVIDYAILSKTNEAVVTLSARGECRAEVCRLVDVGKLATSWFLDVALRNTDHTVGLYTSVRSIGALVREHPELFRNVRRFSTVAPVLTEDFALARDKKNSIVEERIRSLVNLPIEEGMVVATDASLGTGHRAGIAAVATRGRVRARSLLVESVADAEFWAVEMALTTWAGKTPVLHILTDSQIVYKALNGAEKPTGCATSLRKCFKRMDRAEVYVHWVRGHRGNVLNELANDVAMYTRRNACWGLVDTQKEMLERSKVELKAMLVDRKLSDFIPAARGEDAWTATGYAA